MILCVALTVFFFAGGCASHRTSTESLAIRAHVNELIRSVPAEDPVERDRLDAGFMEMGAPGVRELCSRLLHPGLGDDSRFRTALTSLGTFVSRPGAEMERVLYVKAIIEALKSEPENEVRAFLIRRLQAAGRDESVPVLARFITHPDLGEPAITALTAIASPGAQEALAGALEDTQGSNRLAIINGLADLQSSIAVSKILGFAKSESRMERLSAIRALAQIGDPSADAILAQSMRSAQPADRSLIAGYYLIYAQRVGEMGDKVRSIQICRQILDEFKSESSNTVCQTALGVLVKMAGPEAMADLLETVMTGDTELAAAALDFTMDLPGPSITAKLVNHLQQEEPQIGVLLLRTISDRGDLSALPAILKQTESSNKGVRLAAISASVRLGKKDALSRFIEILKGPDPDEIAAVKEALFQIPISEIITPLASSFSVLSIPGRIAVLEVVSGQPGTEVHNLVGNAIEMDDSQVRIAAARALERTGTGADFRKVLGLYLASTDPGGQEALRTTCAVLAGRTMNPRGTIDSLISDYWSSSAHQRQSLLGLLARVGEDSVLKILAVEALNRDQDMREHSVKLLSGWPGQEAVDILLSVAEKSGDPKSRTLALRGCLRIAEQEQLSPRSRLNIIRKTLAVASEPDEKRLILAGLAQVGTPESLSLIAEMMRDQSVSFDAAITALSMVSPVEDNGNRLHREDIARSFIDVIVDTQTARRVDEHFETLAGLNQPPEGFELLFNGNDLSGWKGLVKDPPARAQIDPIEMKSAQAEADSLMRDHWRVENGILVFDGNGHSLCTAKDYGDFEMLVDWKIGKEGDSGIYLRGSPQVQIWDPAQWPVGSGGLYNNQKGPSNPLEPADNPIGEWNSFRIKMIGERVTVHLNGVLVVDDVVLENYWERDKPIYPVGQIELQSHNSPLYFRNIYIREIPRVESPHEGLLFNGNDLSGWESIGGNENSWQVDNGVLFTNGGGGGWLSTQREFANFKLELEFRVPSGGNSGIFLRAPHQGDPAYTGMEIQVLDDYAEQYANLKPWQYTGSVYAVQPPATRASKQANQWQKMTITCDGPRIRVVLNNEQIINTNLIDHMDKTARNPGLKRRRGFIGLQNHGTKIEYRNIRLVELSDDE